MDKEYINKVVEDIFVKGMSKLEIKIEVYKRLDKELKGEDRVHLKILEYEIQQLEDDEMEFKDFRMPLAFFPHYLHVTST